MNIEKILTGESLLEQETIIKPLDLGLHSQMEMIKRISKFLRQDYQFTPEITELMKLLLEYFTGKDSFKVNFLNSTGVEGSLNKGILLIGGVGVGKTQLFRIFKIYTNEVLRKNGFQVYDSSEIVDNLNILGKEYYLKFSNNFIDENKSKPITCYIDDIGSRNEMVMHYGSRYNAIEELLSIRYNIFIKHRRLTHLSTNLYRVQLQDMYGERIIDRMREMFNIIELKGSSFRK